MIFCEEDFVFKGENLDKALAFIKEYKKEEISGLRNECSKLFETSKKSGKLEYSPKCGFYLYYDKNNEEFDVIIKNEYDAGNLLSVLFDLLIESSDLSEEMEIAEKHESIERYLDKISKNEKIDFSKDKDFLKDLVSKMVTTISTYDCQDIDDEEELERVSDIIDELYYEPMSEKFEEMISLFSSKHIKIDEVNERDE